MYQSSLNHLFKCSYTKVRRVIVPTRQKKRERTFEKKTYLRFPLCKHTVIVRILNINQCFVRQKSGLSSNASFNLKIRRRRLSRFLAKLSNINLPYPSISSEALQFLESSLSHSLLSNTSSRSLCPPSHRVDTFLILYSLSK